MDQLVSYGRELYVSGRPYNHYVETVNVIAVAKPTIRRMLTGAWDLAFSWQREEPGGHHTACPYQVLLAILSVCILWGWPLVAGSVALSWGAITRIGEVLQAQRRDLVLPEDVGFSSQSVFLRVKEPKNAFQSSKTSDVKTGCARSRAVGFFGVCRKVGRREALAFFWTAVENAISSGAQCDWSADK